MRTSSANLWHCGSGICSYGLPLRMQNQKQNKKHEVDFAPADHPLLEHWAFDYSWELDRNCATGRGVVDAHLAQRDDAFRPQAERGV